MPENVEFFKKILTEKSCAPGPSSCVESFPTSSHVVATTTLVAIDRANCVCSTSRGPREVQNRGRWLQKRFRAKMYFGAKI